MAKLLDVGEMRQRIEIQIANPADQVVSPSGVPPQDLAQTWTTLGTYWASVTPQRIRRSIGVDAPRSALWSLVIMRHPGFPVTIAHRLVHQGTRIFVIDAVQRVEERNEFLSIECTENPLI